MDDQRSDREGGRVLKPRTSRWLIVIPVIFSGIAINRPAPIIIFASIVAWAYWAVVTFRPLDAAARPKSQRLGCGLSAIGAVVLAVSFMIGFGQSMSPGSNGDIFLVPMMLGGALMLFGLLALLTGQK